MVFEEGFLKNTDTDDTVYFKDFLAYVYVQVYAKRFQKTSVSSVSVCPRGISTPSNPRGLKFGL